MFLRFTTLYNKKMGSNWKSQVPFYVYLLSCMLIFAGVDAVLSLVSSVNIEDGKGLKF